MDDHSKTEAIDTERLIDILRGTCCATWSRKDIARDKLLRFAQAYLMMARAGYRPAAPSCGCGDIQLTKDRCDDRERLYREAVKYAAEFNRDEDADRDFFIGCSNWETNRAFVLSIEAARLLASGSDGDVFAARLLRLALKEIADAIRRRKKRNGNR